MREDNQVDMVVIVSTELIQEVMEGYFRELIPGRFVRIVDSNPTESGFGFSLSFKEPEREVPTMRLKASGYSTSSNAHQAQIAEAAYKRAYSKQEALQQAFQRIPHDPVQYRFTDSTDGQSLTFPEQEQTPEQFQRSLSELLANLETENTNG